MRVLCPPSGPEVISPVFGCHHLLSMSTAFRPLILQAPGFFQAFSDTSIATSKAQRGGIEVYSWRAIEGRTRKIYSAEVFKNLCFISLFRKDVLVRAGGIYDIWFPQKKRKWNCGRSTAEDKRDARNREDDELARSNGAPSGSAWASREMSWIAGRPPESWPPLPHAAASVPWLTASSLLLPPPPAVLSIALERPGPLVYILVSNHAQRGNGFLL
jgi:hypothetical protein